MWKESKGDPIYGLPPVELWHLPWFFGYGPNHGTYFMKFPGEV
jgi:hypothetical protein